MPPQLSEQEIDQRLIKLRNLEQAYPKLQDKYRLLEVYYRTLSLEVLELKGVIAGQAKQIEQLSHTVEEFKRIIFGRKKQPPKDPPANADNSSGGSDSNKQPRPASSYRRPIPPEEEVSDTQTFTFEGMACSKCGTTLTRVKKVIRYVEDLLPLSQWKKALKRVTRMLITTGYCSCCRQRVSAAPIPKQLVSLGHNLKQFITFGNVILRLSYGQVNDLLKTMAGLQVSDGEMDNIFYEQADKLQPECGQIKIRLDKEDSNNYDETSWPTQNGQFGDYAWVRASSITEEALFLIGRSRGKGNLNGLMGPPEQTGITDDYLAYRKAFKSHALCWAHPRRKFRDLTEATYLTDSQRARTTVTNQSFAALYQKVRTVCSTPFVLTERLKVLPELETEFERISQPHRDDPKKLLTFKQSLRKNQPCYFVCVIKEGVSPDNNKAERTLRHLVLKRKNSYGSKSQRGADASSILYSVLLSLWRTSKDRFFTEYQRLLDQTKSLQITSSKLA